MPFSKLEAEVRQLAEAIEKAEGDAEKNGREFGQKLIRLRGLRKKDKRQLGRARGVARQPRGGKKRLPHYIGTLATARRSAKIAGGGFP